MRKPPNRNACYDRPAQAPSYHAQDGYLPAVTVGDEPGIVTRMAAYVSVPHVMSEQCVYSTHTADPKCAGCQWDSGGKPREVAP